MKPCSPLEGVTAGWVDGEFFVRAGTEFDVVFVELELEVLVLEEVELDLVVEVLGLEAVSEEPAGDWVGVAPELTVVFEETEFELAVEVPESNAALAEFAFEVFTEEVETACGGEGFEPEVFVEEFKFEDTEAEVLEAGFGPVAAWLPHPVKKITNTPNNAIVIEFLENSFITTPSFPKTEYPKSVELYQNIKVLINQDLMWN